MSQTLRIAITVGEPAGIGPDLCVALEPREGIELVLIGDPATLVERAESLNLSFQATKFIVDKPHPGAITVFPVRTAAEVVAGTLNPENAQCVLDSISIAVNGCEKNRFDAMVTAPVHKGVINDAGIPFTGHTEFIAEKLNATPLMVLAAGNLRVALVTTHLPLKDVAAAITHEAIVDSLNILHTDLISKYKIPAPHILACGLNPHAGESGHLGDEEIKVITPAIQAAIAQGINVTGPLPADTLFTERHLKDADAVLAMYHDQGLPVLKYAGFGKAVNITMGLPIIRTSVDHGTALDLAGTGKADGGSLRAAIDLSIELAKASSSTNS